MFGAVSSWLSIDRSSAGDARSTHRRQLDHGHPTPQCPSRQPPRVTAPGRPVMCLRMVLAWQPAAISCLGNYIPKCRNLVRRAVFHAGNAEHGQADQVSNDDGGQVGQQQFAVAIPPHSRARHEQSECQQLTHQLELTCKGAKPFHPFSLSSPWYHWTYLSSAGVWVWLVVRPGYSRGVSLYGHFTPEALDVPPVSALYCNT